MKVLLISVDGVRPDALVQMEAARYVFSLGAVALHASSVVPSVTLPRHRVLYCLV